jgi:cellulose synthase/poly-beta-1,6-N-acetylglucosamine synthase-like glycosyltransferase
VDNGSRDDTADLAARSPVVARVIRRGRGEGPGAARNAGAAASRGEVLAFLDADCRPAPGWLASGVAAAAEHDLVQGLVLPDPGVPVGPFDRTLAVAGAHGLFESANLFVRRELFERIGGFPAGLEAGASAEAAPFGEDVLFGWRARRAGARTGFDERALAFHEVFARGPAGFVSERTRLAMFPALAARVPELRTSFFHRRVFLSPRSAAFDFAAIGAALALLSRRRLPLIAAAPYARLLVSEVRRWGPRAPLVASVEVIADAVGATALVRGSLAARSPVL